MFRNTPSHEHSWLEFAKVLELIDLYVKIEEKRCNVNDLKKLAKYNLQDDKESADYIRSVLYPEEMQRIGCTSGRHYIGRESVVYFTYDFDDIDEFFSEFIPTREEPGKRNRLDAYLSVIEVLSKEQTESRPRHYHSRHYRKS